ncbi:Vegetative incompatibility protein HET-E-1 like [Verticillium longisporum]|nr:Vegetative incompatibility protein HET-E-1 like [Verticillium longisporum]
MFSRKQRGADSELPPSPPSSRRTSTTSSKKLFSLSKTFSRTPTGPPKDHAEDPKGPLGLTLLHSPRDPKVDFIFVHGLGGGSRKTWSKTTLRSHYWPKEWLPKDPSFEHVRIHSYGYDSDYLRGKEDCLNIHHIGKAFLGVISTSPCLSTSSTSIVAIGHSMGGLVIKKAYLLARQDAAHHALASRFTTIYFLATPHRGADSAKTLKNMLRIAYDRSYVGDLERNSATIQTINDEFRHFSSGLELWSFYETQVMKLLNTMIVDPESAVLGYREEQQVPMNADHRSICKFDTAADATYTTLRNALASTVVKLAVAIQEPMSREKRDSIKDLRAYLDVPDIVNDDLLSVRESRLHDTCGWISTKAVYTNWRDGESVTDRALWVKGKPATGKSVLAGYVIDNLREAGHQVSYFFFKHGDRSKSSLSRCLRSLAFQMACSNTNATQSILEMQLDGIRLDHVGERTLWRLLFLSGIFKATGTRQYWVIDAVDECSSTSTLVNAIFSNMEDSVPLRIIFTSRDTTDLDLRFSNIDAQTQPFLAISASETLPDFKLLIRKGTQALSVVKPKDRALLAAKILDKSKGSFLGTILVLKELLRCHSIKEINQVLEDVPRGMEPLYRRTLDTMSQATRGKNLSKTILRWVVCALRPMTVGELSGALALDVDDAFPRLEESITALCGQLVVVDMFGRVQMVHETAREFLLKTDLESEFGIDPTMVHTRMAQVCLTYLVGDEMKPPRTNRRHSPAHLLPKREDFAAYACTAYSYHLARAVPSISAEPLQLIGKFLKSNVLTWIEVMAHSRDLNQLIRTSKHLKAYVNAYLSEMPPLDPRIKTLRQWAVDLARMPAMFANALAVSPQAVYSLIPPFCPTSSMIFNTTGPPRRLSVIGASHEQWDDRLLHIDFNQGRPSAMRYGDDFLAIGLTSGHVALYYTNSYQQYKYLEHGETVKLIAFRSKSNFIATCGLKMVKVWDIASGEVIHNFTSPPRPLDMTFDGQLLLIASDKNYLATWDLGQTDVLPEPTQKPWSDTPGASRTPPRRPPGALTISTTHKVIAAAYSGQPIMLWDMEDDAYAGSCGKTTLSGETSTHVVVALAFNPNPDVVLLAVAYLDGELALLDPFANQQVECIHADCQTLAASHDGRLLAAGGANGIINVYEFDTFKLLYRVKSSNSYIRQIGFARRSRLLADIRGAQCTVWEPAALLRDALTDDSSGTTSASTVEIVALGAKAQITAMEAHPSGEVIFGGKDNGIVVLYDRKTAVQLQTLGMHKTSIRLLAWCHRLEALLSIDASGKLSLHELKKPVGLNQTWDVRALFQSRLESDIAIVDLLVGETLGKLLISTHTASHLISLDDGRQEIEKPYPESLGNRQWLQHPRNPQHLICVEADRLGIYTWADLSPVASFPILLDGDRMLLKHTIICTFDQEQRIMLEFSSSDGSSRTCGITLLDENFFDLKDHLHTWSLRPT